MSPTFADLGVPDDLVHALKLRRIDAPFPIQAATIADALAGRDVCGRAPTGSGKTLAFGIPLIAQVERGTPRRPRALILAPTRELAQQIHDELAPLASARKRRMLTVYGGVGYGGQRGPLRKGVDVVVACPGRLEDLESEGAIDLSDVDLVVVDEADRMADMGFLPSVRRLLDATRRDRQTVLFSATLDGDVAVLTKRYQNDPVRHEVGDVEPDITSARHFFWKVKHEDRRGHAAEIVAAAGPTVVFCRTRRGADRVAANLGKDGVKAAAIHGGRSQGQRDRALASFANGRVAALVATDVAARGIHVDDVACVLHFDPPEDEKAYLHRSGRTARAHATGTVVSLIRPDEVKSTRSLQRQLGLPAEVDAPDVSVLGEGRPHPADKSRRSDRAEAPAAKDRRDRTGRRDHKKHKEHRNKKAANGRPSRTGNERPAEHASRTPRQAGGEGSGTVKFFDTRRGYGFIEVNGEDDLFVHHTQLVKAKGLDAGQTVSFDIGKGRKGVEAHNVRVDAAA